MLTTRGGKSYTMMGGGPADEEDAGTRKDESRIPRCRTLSAETQRASLH